MLAGRGHAVTVLTTTSRPTASPGVDIRTIAWPIVNNVAAPDLRRVPAIAAILEDVRPDIVHAHGMFFSLSIGTILAASRLRIPSMSTVHSLLRPWPVYLAGCVVFRLFSNRATTLTAVSAATAGDVQRASGRPVVRIPNGLSLADWRVPDRRLVEGVRIAAVTRLVPKKSPIDLVRALHRARLRRPDVTLSIAGDGSERARLVREAHRLGVAEHVEFLGACTRAQVRDLLSGASMLAHPGTLEAFGLALLEARAAGVPVAAIGAGGVPDLVTDRRHGLLARTRREFPDVVAELAFDDGLRGRCAAAAPSGLDAFDWSEVVRRYEAAYLSTIDGGQGAPRRGPDEDVAREEEQGRKQRTLL